MNRDRSIRAYTAMRILKALDEAGIAHCVLRNHEDIPRDPGRDIDLIASDESLPAVESVVASVATEDGWDRILRCRGHHEGTSFYLIKQRHDSVVQLEMHFTRVRWAGIPILEQEEVLQERYREDWGLWVAHPAHLAIQRLLQFGLSGQLEDMKVGYWSELKTAVGSNRDGVEFELERLLGDQSTARRITHAVMMDEPTAASHEISRHRHSFGLQRLRDQPSRLSGAIMHTGIRYFEKWRTARCGVVAIATSAALVKSLKAAVSPLFVRTQVFDVGSLDRISVREAVRTVNRVGVVFITTESPEVEIDRSAWRNVSHVIDSDSVELEVHAIIQRFAANHETVDGGP